ncbi:MAG: FAD-dependent oxidoreductase, partial [Desulfobacteraceae bacterium]
MNNNYDLIIIGGGISGMTAAIYAARANLNTLVLEKAVCGGLVNTTHVVENFPSYLSINGMELMEKVRSH